MSTTTPIGWKELPCPACGYDLRARTGTRCPECGAEVRDIVSSHIPWVHRRQLGSVRAFLRTVTWACLSPSRLTGDFFDRIGGRPARSFNRICLWLGTLMAMTFVLAAYAMTSPTSRASFEMGVPTDGSSAIPQYIFPALALLNSFWGLIPLFLCCFLSLAWASRLLRTFLAFSAGNPRHCRRVYRIGHYAAALLLPEVLLLGTILVLVAVIDNDDLHLGLISAFLGPLGLVSLIAAVGIFGVSAGMWVWRTGGNRVTRLLILLVIYPPSVYAIAGVMTFVMFWTCGYAAMAIHSMLAR